MADEDDVLETITAFLETEFDLCKLDGPSFSQSDPHRRHCYWLTDTDDDQYTIHFTEAFIFSRVGWEPDAIVRDLDSQGVIEEAQSNINDIVVVKTDRILIEEVD